MTRPWSAPRSRSAVDAAVQLPGSKSVTNRALLIAALADGDSLLTGRLHSRDTDLMAAAVRALGAGVSDLPDGTCVVGGTGGRPARGPAVVDVGLAGTVARFTPALAALGEGPATFDGDVRMRDRPMGPLLRALRTLGCRITAPEDRLPFTVEGTGGVAGGEVTLDASDSSQLVSALLLAGPAFDHGVVVHHRGGRLPSRPHVDMTVAMMRAGGAGVTVDGDSWSVAPSGYRAGPLAVEPDLSGAAPFLAAAVVTGGRIRVGDWPHATTQPGAALPALLRLMGARCTLDDHGLTVTGPGTIDGIDVDLRDCSELAPVLAAIAVLATGPSRLVGLAHVRHHETDRLHALATELSRTGAAVTDDADGLRIHPAPRPLRGALLHAEGDHRLAMAYAVLGLVIDDVAVDDIGVTAKTMPDFVARWSRMLDQSETPG